MKKILAIMIPALAIFACDDIFEKDITDQRVGIVAPSDGLTVTPGEVIFLWRQVEGASSYHLQIICGPVSGGGFVVADTIMHNDSTGVKRSFRQHLDEGEYRWSVRAQNGAYQTEESVSTLYVYAEDIADISGTDISIIAPYDGAELEPGYATFLWREVKGASSYHITIVSPDFGNARSVVADETLSSCSFTTSVPAGSYQWSLKAANDKYETAEQVFSFKIVEPEDPEEIEEQENP